MTAFKTIKGVPVKTVAGGQPNAYPSPFEGELFYDSDGAGAFKFVGAAAAGTWASGGALNQVRGSNKGFGIQTAAISAGGAHENPGATSNSTKTELYNGSSWTEVNDLNVGRQAFGSLGTATAGFCAAGFATANVAIVENWNGTSWTEIADINTARASVRGCGTTSAALLSGGYNPSPALQIAVNELWDGTSWTEVNDLNTRRSGAGNAINSPSTDSIIFGGYTQPPPNTANAETWDGTSWTEVGNLNTAKDNMGGSGDASTSALCFGGRSTIVNTEDWNGSSWTEVNNMATGRGYMASGGTSSSAIISGGEAPGYTAATEEWTIANPIKTVALS